MGDKRAAIEHGAGRYFYVAGAPSEVAWKAQLNDAATGAVLAHRVSWPLIRGLPSETAARVWLEGMADRIAALTEPQP